MPEPGFARNGLFFGSFLERKAGALPGFDSAA